MTTLTETPRLARQIDWRLEFLQTSNDLQPRVSKEFQIMRHQVSEENPAATSHLNILIKSAKKAEGKTFLWKILGAVFLETITLMAVSSSLNPEINFSFLSPDKLTAAWLVYAVIAHKIDSRVQEEVQEKFRPAVKDLEKIYGYKS